MRDKLPEKLKTGFDIMVVLGTVIGLPFLVWVSGSITELKEARGEDEATHAQVTEALRENKKEHGQIAQQLDDLEHRQEKAHGEMKVGRTISCQILHKLDPGAPCPEIESD